MLENSFWPLREISKGKTMAKVLRTKITRTRQQSIKLLGELIEDFRVAMLTSMDKNGALRSRPMITLYTKFEGDLWFFTHAHTNKVDEVQQHHQINVCYADSERERYISISGRAEIVRDRWQIEALWNPIYKTQFPQALADPDLALLKMSVEQAEYWDPDTSAMVQFTDLIKSIVTDKPFENGVHEVIALSPTNERTRSTTA